MSKNKWLIVGLCVLCVLGVALEAQVRLRLRARTEPTPPEPPPTTSRGPQNVPCPVGATQIGVGTDIQSVVNAQPAGTVYCLLAGTHREQSITPKNGDQYYGQIGAVLSGARVLSSWTPDGGGRWYATGQPQFNGVQGTVPDECIPGNPRCGYGEDLWVDGSLRFHTDSIGAVNASSWHFDYGNDRIYIGEDPAGKAIQTSVTARAFQGSASNVRIQNLVIERYANLAQSGAVHAQEGSNWTLTYSDFNHNHGYGIRTGSGLVVTHSRIMHNAQLGTGGPGVNILYDNVEIANNNLVGFQPGWEGGGSKWAITSGVTVRNSYIHNNFGPGLWTDIDNYNTLYELNVVEDNAGIGIFHEISYDCVIRRNTVRRNGWGGSDWIWGGGIIIAASGGTGCNVYENTLEDQPDGLIAVQQNRGSFIAQNIHFYDNTVRLRSPENADDFNGAIQDNGFEIFSRNVTFENNDYFMKGSCNHFVWANTGPFSFATWQGYGHDDTGSCTVY